VTPVVGFLGPALDRRQHWLAAFRTGLDAEGFVDGQNMRIEYRSADGGAKALPELAADVGMGAGKRRRKAKAGIGDDFVRIVPADA
jgi:hypothetical protein